MADPDSNCTSSDSGASLAVWLRSHRVDEYCRAEESGLNITVSTETAASAVFFIMLYV